MGASVGAYWPGITEEQLEGEPGFWNDCKAWGNFMAEYEDEPDVLDTFRRLGASALLTYKTDGVDDSDVEWVSPEQLREATQIMQDAVRQNLPGIERILEVYARNANKIDSVAQEFLTDLADIQKIADWAGEQGAEVMTLEVNW
jgi:hypothetical protein